MSGSRVTRERRGEHMTIQSHANRLAVFSAVKRLQQRHRRRVTADEVMAVLAWPMAQATVDRHLRALDGADGLSFTTIAQDRAERTRERVLVNDSPNEHGLLEVDTVMKGERRLMPWPGSRRMASE